MLTKRKRISSWFPAFADSTDDGGEINVTAAGEDGVFFSVKTGIEAGGRPIGGDGLQTFGAVRALARYIKIEVVPASSGAVTISEARKNYRVYNTADLLRCNIFS